MDENDLKILEILSEDSRTPYDVIGKKVDLTGNAVRTRVIRMIEDGVVEQFIFKIHPDVFDIKNCYVYFKYPQSANIAENINADFIKVNAEYMLKNEFDIIFDISEYSYKPDELEKMWKKYCLKKDSVVIQCQDKLYSIPGPRIITIYKKWHKIITE